MAERVTPPVKPEELELVITRVFDAPRKLVFIAWTDPAHLVHWWGPHSNTLVSCKVELRPGGAYDFHMRGASGQDFRAKGTFVRVIEPELLEWTGSWVDASGNPTGPMTRVTVKLEEHQGKTTMTLRQVGFESAASRDAHRGGWTDSIEKLAEHLKVMK